MKRRGFLAVLLAAPAVPALAKIADEKKLEIPKTPLMTATDSPHVALYCSAFSASICPMVGSVSFSPAEDERDFEDIE